MENGVAFIDFWLSLAYFVRKHQHRKQHEQQQQRHQEAIEAEDKEQLIKAVVGAL